MAYSKISLIVIIIALIITSIGIGQGFEIQSGSRIYSFIDGSSVSQRPSVQQLLDSSQILKQNPINIDNLAHISSDSSNSISKFQILRNQSVNNYGNYKDIFLSQNELTESSNNQVHIPAIRPDLSNSYSEFQINNFYSFEKSEPYKLVTNFPVSLSTDVKYSIDPNSPNIYIINNSNLFAQKREIPSDNEAIRYAEAIINMYGGMPDGSVLTGIEQVYIDKINPGGVQSDSKPLYTQVCYHREINGRRVVGGGGVIEVYLGENGDLLGLIKVWRDIINSVPVPIISAEEAYELLLRGDALNGIPQNGRDTIYINNIQFGYYEPGYGTTTQWMIPVWIFSGYTENQNSVSLIVKAEE